MGYRPYIEMTLFDSAKETENKLRWDCYVDGTLFALYIPKWRVPKPWPKTIAVQIVQRRAECSDEANLTGEHLEADPTLSLEPIVATVRKVSVHTKTVRYDPIASVWEIGSPYVPDSMTFDSAELLRVIVNWDLVSRGAFSSGVQTSTVASGRSE